MINSILNDKKQQLIASGGTKRATFTTAEIDVLMDLNELRVFKLANPFPKDYEFCKTEKESIQRVLTDGSPYSVLEYCVLSQPVLQYSIREVYKNWRFFNGIFGVRQHRAGTL